MSSKLFDNPRRKALSLTSDYVFKYVYGEDNPESKRALMDMLNVILNRGDNPIVDFVIKNPISNRQSEEDKQSIMDIRVETSSGELIDVEIQRNMIKHFAERCVYYNSQMVSNSLSKGEYYDKMKTSIVISIIDSDKVISPKKDCHSVYCFSDIETGHVLTKITQIHLVELAKIDTKKPVSKLTKLERLAAYLKYACDETHGDYVEEIISDTEEITMSENRLRELTEHELEFERARARRMWELDRGTEAAERAELEKEIGEAKESLGATKKELGEAKQELGETKQELGEAKQELGEAKQELGEAKQELVRLSQLNLILLEAGRIEDLKRTLTDKDFKEKLYKEFDL